jgi:hypothetical protein
MHSRFAKHFDILCDEQHLTSVFSLYVMSFDDKNASFDRLPGAYFREFKKAYYSLVLSDTTWLETTSHIE